jgi:hypothetical protein
MQIFALGARCESALGGDACDPRSLAKMIRHELAISFAASKLSAGAKR